MKLSSALAFFSLSLPFAPTVADADACHVAAYLPGWVGWVVTAEMPHDRVVALPPPGFVATDAPVLPAGKTTLVRSSRLVGTATHVDDPVSGRSSFVVDDANGKALFEVRLDLAVCRVPGRPAGLCKTVTARTSLEPPLPDGGEPLEMSLGPDADEFPVYRRYGTVVDFATWHHAFGDMINWLHASLATTSLTTTPDLSTPEAKAYWALASEPDVAPYLGGLSFVHRAAGDGFAVRGRLPTDELITTVRTALAGVGYASPQLELTVDASVAVPRLNQDKLLPCAIN